MVSTTRARTSRRVDSCCVAICLMLAGNTSTVYSTDPTPLQLACGASIGGNFTEVGLPIGTDGLYEVNYTLSVEYRMYFELACRGDGERMVARCVTRLNSLACQIV